MTLHEMNPTSAQIDRMMNGPSGQAIIYHPHSPSSLPEKTKILIGLNTVNVARSAWKALRLASSLGVDLVYITKSDSDHTVFAIEPFRNTMIEILTTDCDPESAGFGEADQRIDGAVLFKFGDRNEGDMVSKGRLGKAPLDSLELFISERLEAIRAARAKGDLELAKQEYAKMTPVEFKKFFKHYRAGQAAEFKGMGWEKQVCPVKVEGELCENCGAEKDGERALMRCGKCKRVMYCGRECQAEDWKAHKPFCGSA